MVERTETGYKRGNILIPGVTTVLHDCGIIEYNQYVTTEKGTRLHKLIQQQFEKKINWTEITEEELLFLQKFNELTEQYEFVKSECILYNSLYNYAGTCDLFSESIIGELKTGKPEPWHLLQLAAYVNCLDDAYGILVYPFEKKNPVREYNRERLRVYFKHFICSLDVYNFKRISD